MSHRVAKSARQHALSSAFRTAVIVSLGTVGASACLYGLHPHITLEGKPFSPDRLASVREGMSEQEVLDSIGTPLETRHTDESYSVWRYYERARLRGCKVEFLGIVPVGDSPIRSVEALVFLRDGRVERVQFSETE